ncbi:hypothetical protein CS022_03460 [Veronia nyctiphanis]|uniref:Uncharacterized protein n=1 Tax=Veronia nyctiphanis TaxID=1278244 RepID=A0A4Q0YTM1_9GAMM|nr:hypothetical protein [Veronia nyctiphanis]RXJ74632.1 hypothetical protein CS022_03460 [Veronia nyctiphanis]
MLVSIGFFEQLDTASIADLSLWQQESDEIFSHIVKSKIIKVLSQALIQNGNIVRLQREISAMQKTSLGQVHTFESGCRCGDHQVVTLVNQDLLNQDIMKPALVSYGDVESTLIIAPSVDEISDDALKIAKQSVINVYPTQSHFSNTLHGGYKASYSEGSNLNMKIISLAGDDASSLAVKAS